MRDEIVLNGRWGGDLLAGCKRKLLFPHQADKKHLFALVPHVVLREACCLLIEKSLSCKRGHIFLCKGDSSLPSRGERAIYMPINNIHIDIPELMRNANSNDDNMSSASSKFCMKTRCVTHHMAKVLRLAAHMKRKLGVFSKWFGKGLGHGRCVA